MNKWFPAALAFALLTSAVTLGGAAGTKEWKQLQGTWVALSAEENGKPKTSLKGHLLTFDGDKFTIKSADGKVLYQGMFQLVPGKKVAGIDFQHTEGARKGQTCKGIFAVEGDTLKTCDNGPEVSKDRPKELGAGSAAGYVSI